MEIALEYPEGYVFYTVTDLSLGRSHRHTPQAENHQRTAVFTTAGLGTVETIQTFNLTPETQPFLVVLVSTCNIEVAVDQVNAVPPAQTNFQIRRSAPVGGTTTRLNSIRNQDIGEFVPISIVMQERRTSTLAHTYVIEVQDDGLGAQTVRNVNSQMLVVYETGLGI